MNFTDNIDENLEFNALYDDEYFIIDSNNLDKIKPKLYGFAVYDGKIFSDLTISNEYNLTGQGTYIWVKKEDDKVTIYQDFNGSYGLHLFRKDNYFAISNSFLKLVEYLKERFELTFNEDYAKAFLSVPHGSFSYFQTLIEEIIILDRNSVVNIDTIYKSISIDKIDYKENTISIDSIEGLATLDKWYYTWTNLIRFLKKNTNNLQVDLSGGFDTRMIFTLMIGSKIDLNTIKVFSYKDKKHTHEEDYEIASEIADYFGFKLNQPLSTSLDYFSQLSTPINISFYSKLGFHRQMYYKVHLFKEPIFTITGGGGGSIRGFWMMNPEEFVSYTKELAKRYSKDFIKPTEKLLRESFEIIQEKYGITDKSSRYIPFNMNRDIRCKSHFGRAYAGNYLINAVSLAPFIDPDLQKIKLTTDECTDNQLLMTVILTRYCPELLDFKFDSDRTIDSDTIEYAKKLNDKYPFKEQDFNEISKSNENIIIPAKKIPISSNTLNIKREDCEKYIHNVFHSKSFKHSFEKYYPPEIYEYIVKTIEKSNYFSLANAYTAMGVVKIREDVEYSHEKNFKTNYDWLEHFSEIPGYSEKQIYDYDILEDLSKYLTARIDIKNRGTNINNVEYLCGNDQDVVIKNSQWLKTEEGQAVIIKSRKGRIDFKVKCIEDGEFILKLKGIDFRDKNNKRIPILIDYTSLKINDLIVLDYNKTVCHDKPFTYTKTVTDGEIIDIHVEWKLFSNESISPLENKSEEVQKESNELLKYETARVDIKNIGNIENNIEIIDSSETKLEILSPKWFKNDEGQGKIIHSNKGILDFKIKCIKNGKLRLNLKGIDFKNRDNKRIPIYIDYTKFEVNESIIFNSEKTVSHDEPYTYIKSVADDEIVKIHLEWKSFTGKKMDYEEEPIDNLRYLTARLDMKNNGNEENKIEVIESSDKNANISIPKWFKNNQGQGTVIESTEGTLNLKIKCICEGQFKLDLKGVDYRDKNHNRIPIYIDYRQLMINNTVIFDKDTLVCHDKPYTFNKKVEDGEILDIQVVWTSVNQY